MPLQGALDWLLIAVCVLTYGMLIATAVGVLRQALALKRRVEKLCELPMFVALPKAESDLDRLSNAVLEAEALALRGVWASARIRAMVLTIVRFAYTVRGH